jgi:hypothetical protein
MAVCPGRKVRTVEHFPLTVTAGTGQDRRSRWLQFVRRNSGSPETMVSNHFSVPQVIERKAKQVPLVLLKTCSRGARLSSTSCSHAPGLVRPPDLLSTILALSFQLLRRFGRRWEGESLRHHLLRRSKRSWHHLQVEPSEDGWTQTGIYSFKGATD